MNKMKVTAAVLGATLVVGAVVAARVSAAQDQNQGDTWQTQNQKSVIEQKCEIGQYGGTCTQKAETDQSQTQVLGANTKIAYKDGQPYHSPVNTALDLQTMLTAGGVMLTSAGAYAVKRKIA